MGTIQYTDFRKPGVELMEEQTAPSIAGTSTDIAGMVIACRRGDTDKVMSFSSWEDFVKRCGGGTELGYYGSCYGPFAVREFFREDKGQFLKAVRVVSAGAEKATNTAKGLDGVDDTVKVDAKDYGAYGDSVSITTLKYEVETTAPILLNAAEKSGSTTVNSVVDMTVGDFVVISDGTTTIRVYVWKIDAATGAIYFREPAHAEIASGATVQCYGTHLCNTTTAEALVNGATSVLLNDVSGVVIGTVLWIDKYNAALPAYERLEVIVTAVSGSRVSFAAVTLSDDIPSGANVVSTMEFDLTVKDCGSKVEEISGLSMSDTNETNFIEVRLSGENNESNYVVLTDLDSSEAVKAHHIPMCEDMVLSGGSDGSAITDSEWLGSSSEPKTGLYLFDGEEVDMLAIPGVETQAVIQGGIEYVDARQDVQGFIYSHPYADNTPDLVRQHKKFTVNKPSSRAMMYSPWLKVKDPRKSKTVGFWIPPEGHVMAEWAQTSRKKGIHVAPANSPLSGTILDLSIKLTNADSAALIALNHDGINMIRNFPGKGYRIYGARTCNALQNGFHYVPVRRMLTWIENSVLGFLQDYVFAPNMISTRASAQDVVDDFLYLLWKNKQLVPENSREKAYFVKCDEENNIEESVDLGYFIMDVGVNLPKPAEFVIFRVSLFKGDGSASVTESSI